MSKLVQSNLNHVLTVDGSRQSIHSSIALNYIFYVKFVVVWIRIIWFKLLKCRETAGSYYTKQIQLLTQYELVCSLVAFFVA